MSLVELARDWIYYLVMLSALVVVVNLLQNQELKLWFSDSK